MGSASGSLSGLIEIPSGPASADELPDDVAAFARVRPQSPSASDPGQIGGPWDASQYDAPASAPGSPGDSPPRAEEASLEALLDGSGEFRISASFTDSGSIPVDDAVRSRIDPLVEFNDVFQDIRRAEKGDAKGSGQRYVDADMIGDDETELTEVPPAPAEDRFKTGRLDLKAGDLDQSPAPRREPVPRERREDSDLVAAALAESGYAEPSPAELLRAKKVEAVAALDLSGDAHLRGETYLGTARALGATLVVLTCAVGALAYLASKNDWLLDLREFDQMIGVAFEGQEYVPRSDGTAGPPAIVESVGEAQPGRPAAASALTLGGLTGGVYEATHGGRFALVDGTVTNGSDVDHRDVMVRVRILEASGALIGERIVPIATRLEQPAFEASRSESDLDAHYEQLAGRADDFTLEPGAESIFSGAFLLEAGVDAEQLSYTATLASAERRAPACWAPVEFHPAGAPAEEGSGSAGDDAPEQSPEAGDNAEASAAGAADG